jgi:hypothetical protein
MLPTSKGDAARASAAATGGLSPSVGAMPDGVFIASTPLRQAF